MLDAVVVVVVVVAAVAVVVVVAAAANHRLQVILRRNANLIPFWLLLAILSEQWIQDVLY
jgi:hypothetical protein